jgi:hypothetical protein
LIGALGEGCDVPTPTELATLTIARVALGIEIRWGWEGSGLVSVERAPQVTGPWLEVATERATEGGVTVDLDRSALREQTYWYRLVINDGNVSRVLGSPVEVPSAPMAFVLGTVEPNPSRGPVQINFVVPRQALIALEVFDIQGRKVASLAEGVWQAGAHRVEWAGQRGRASVAAGIYLIRYRFPGGQELRRIALAR